MDVFIAEEVEHGDFRGLNSHPTTHRFGSIFRLRCSRRASVSLRAIGWTI
jgi:hypothetical protein